MCLAVYKPKGIVLPWDYYQNGWDNNSHGAGFAVVNDGTLLVRKGFFKFDDFWREFQQHEHKQAVIHFRYATHGAQNHTNCHPFAVSDGLVMVHNGILDIACSNPKLSDTWHYVDEVLTPMAKRDPDFFLHNEVAFMGGAAIRGSKFIFLRADGEWRIWNEDAGEESDGAWFSNTTYKSARAKSYWWHKKDEPIVLCDEPDGESVYYQYLDGAEKWQYEDLIKAGYTISEIDDYIDTEGTEVLGELLATTEEEI